MTLIYLELAEEEKKADPNPVPEPRTRTTRVRILGEKEIREKFVKMTVGKHTFFLAQVLRFFLDDG
jgi:hypothetical protein